MINKLIEDYLQSLEKQKQNDLRLLHQRIIGLYPDIKQWFENGKNEEGKIISNPNIGYGEHTIRYANGKTKDFFKMSISAIQSGISIYIIGLKDKTFLSAQFGNRIGKAKITGYCVSFKAVQDIHLEVFDELISFALQSNVSF